MAPEEEIQWGQVRRVRGPVTLLSSGDYSRAEAVSQPIPRRASRVRCGSVLLKPLLIQLLRDATQLPLERGPALTQDLLGVR